jgi:hypothetical protein
MIDLTTQQRKILTEATYGPVDEFALEFALDISPALALVDLKTLETAGLLEKVLNRFAADTPDTPVIDGLEQVEWQLTEAGDAVEGSVD